MNTQTQTEHPPDDAGVWGEGLGERERLALIEQAVKDGWDVPQEERAKVVGYLGEQLKRTDLKSRVLLRISRIFVRMEYASLGVEMSRLPSVSGRRRRRRRKGA